MCFGGGVALETDSSGRVGSYAFKASLLLLAPPKSPTLPLRTIICERELNLRSHADWEAQLHSQLLFSASYGSVCTRATRSFWRLLCLQPPKTLFTTMKHHNLCMEDVRWTNRFGTTWGWVINDRILIFEWTKGHCTLKFSHSFFRFFHIPHTFLSKCMQRTQKIKPDPNCFWWLKVSETVCKRDWHNVRSYLFFNVQKFHTQCAETFTLKYSTCIYRIKFNIGQYY